MLPQHRQRRTPLPHPGRERRLPPFLPRRTLARGVAWFELTKRAERGRSSWCLRPRGDDVGVAPSGNLGGGDPKLAR